MKRSSFHAATCILEYLLTDINAICKDHSSLPVIDIPSCKEAVNYLQKVQAYFHGELNEDSKPKGCYLFNGGSGNAVFFNLNGEGSRSDGARQICMAKKGI